MEGVWWKYLDGTAKVLDWQVAAGIVTLDFTRHLLTLQTERFKLPLSGRRSDPK